jgi:hypothetical protein
MTTLQAIVLGDNVRHRSSHTCGTLVRATNPDNIYTTTRPFNIEVVESGYRFIWQEGQY